MIIGITGTLGAGKGTIVEYLMQKHGFKHFSVRGFLTEEINKRGMPVDRDSMTKVANDLRARKTPSYIVEELCRQAQQDGGEVEALKNKGNFYLFAIDCNIKTRYERISQRKSETDNVSFETFKMNEDREMHSDDPAKQNLAKCISMADYVFLNDGRPEELFFKVEKVLSEIRKNKQAY